MQTNPCLLHSAPLKMTSMMVVLVAGLILSSADTALSQQSAIRAANTQIKSAMGDINSAQGSAGRPGAPAKGSRLKLTRMRLDSAKGKLQKAKQILAGANASDPNTKIVQKNYDSATASLNAIEQIISPGSTPKPKTGSGTNTPRTGSSGGTKAPVRNKPAAKRLDYKQEKLLKDSNWNYRESKKYADAAAKVVAQIDGTGPKPIHSEVKQALAYIERAIEKQNYAVGTVNRLPGDHPKVAEMVQKINANGSAIGANQSRLKAESRKLQKITGMENYPSYQKDYELMGALAGRYGNFGSMRQQPEELARIIGEDGQSLKEFQRVAKLYAPLAAQKTEYGLKMEKRAIYAMNKRKGFAAALTDYKKELPKEYAGYIAEAERIAGEAVAEKKPLFFSPNGGIEQNLGWAEKKLVVFRAFGAKTAKPYEDQLAAARARIGKQAKSLESEIIANNPLPPDRFTGPDRDALIKLAIKTWKKEQKDAKVLGARIPTEAWKRKTKWQWYSGAFNKVDTSKVQVQLLIKHNDKLAVVRPINIYKDHMQADTLSAYPFYTLKEKLQPRAFIVLGKIK